MSQDDRQDPPDDLGTDEALLRRRARFDEAMEASREDLQRYLQRRVRNVETAADLTQETFTRMMGYRDSPDIEDQVLLMYRIAHNLVLELNRTRHRRHASQHVSLGQVEPLSADEPPVEEIVDARMALDQLFKRTILKLPPKCRLAFMLNRFDGLSYPQIAEQMGISVKMVEKHIARALRACRAAMAERDT